MALPRDIELIETLGAGNFGVVYVALLREGAIARTVVLKVLKADMAENHEALVRARDEAALLARINHDHIVKVEQLTTLQDRPTVVMEHIEGVTLDRILAHTGPVPVSIALDITARVASALDAAYNRVPPGDSRPLRVIHRDIKPSNIIVSVSGLVKVLDFGAARGDFDARLAVTQNMAIGTPLYMAPEAIEAEGISPALDVYALAATLYELLAGVPLGLLSNRERAHAQRLERRIQMLHLPDLDDHPTQLVALHELLRDALAYDAGQRPNARAIQDICRRMIRELPRGFSLDQWAEAVVEPLHARREITPPPLSGSLLEGPKNLAKLIRNPESPPGPPPRAPEDEAARPVTDRPPAQPEGTRMLASRPPGPPLKPPLPSPALHPPPKAASTNLETTQQSPAKSNSKVLLAMIILVGLGMGVVGVLVAAQVLRSPEPPDEAAAVQDPPEGTRPTGTTSSDPTPTEPNPPPPSEPKEPSASGNPGPLESRDPPPEKPPPPVSRNRPTPAPLPNAPAPSAPILIQVRSLPPGADLKLLGSGVAATSKSHEWQVAEGEVTVEATFSLTDGSRATGSCIVRVKPETTLVSIQRKDNGDFICGTYSK